MCSRSSIPVVLSALLAAALASPGPAQSTVLASRTTTGTVGSSGVTSSTPAISGDGRYTAFATINGLGLVPGLFPHQNVFLFDRTTLTVQAVTTSHRNQLGTGVNWEPAISDDGAWVAFHSSHRYNNLPITTPTNIWARATADLVSASPNYRQITIAYDGSVPNYGSYRPAISADGRHVAFQSNATNLIFGLSTAWGTDIYVVDRDTDGNGIFDEPGLTRTVLVSATPAGARSNGSNSAISGDGRYIVFETQRNNLVAGMNSQFKTILRDRDPDGNGIYDEGNAVSSIASVDPSGTPMWGTWPDISADGTTVAWAFGSIYVRDLAAGTTEIVSRSPLGVVRGGDQPQLSGDGQRVSFTSDSPLTWNNSQAWKHVYLHDRTTLQTTMLSTDDAGHPGNSSSGFGNGNAERNLALSADGAYAAFTSRATNFFTPDDNNAFDVFVHQNCANASTDLGYALAGTGGLFPEFTICGDFTGATEFRLRNALPTAGGFIVIGVDPPQLTPFLGGTLVPQLGLVAAVTTDATGDVTIPLAPIGGGPVVLDGQWLILDPGAPQGVSFSNALALLIP